MSSGGKSGALWDSPPFLRKLALAFHEAAAESGGLSTEKKLQIERSLKDGGYDMTWNALR